MAIRFLVENTRVPQKKKPAASHWQTLSHNVVLSKPRLNGVCTHSVSGDRHRLHRYLKIQLQYDHDQGRFTQNKQYLGRIPHFSTSQNILFIHN